MEFETPRELLRRLKLGREEALQRMLTCLILRAPYPKWNTRSRVSTEGAEFLRRLHVLSFGDSFDAADFIFVDELELAGRTDDERGGAPDWAVLFGDRLWIIELKTEKGSHRADQIPLYFELGHHHFPGARIDVTYLTPVGTRSHAAPPVPDQFAHLTWDAVTPTIESTWRAPRAHGEAEVVEGVLRTIAELHLTPPMWRAGMIEDRDPAVDPVPGEVSLRESAADPTTEWRAAVDATASDHSQRAIDAAGRSLDDLLELRFEINEHCRGAAMGSPVRHVSAWLWRESSGGRALTEGGRASGYEVRISRYRSPSGNP